MKENYLFYMGKPWMTDWLGSVHAHKARFLGVWMSIAEVVDRLPEAVKLMQETRNQTIDLPPQLCYIEGETGSRCLC